ncbi:histidine phosphatase family protein [Chloroflexota bacterium]|nr:histidine phosphatase family protein [Chloroflexota bacterium]
MKTLFLMRHAKSSWKDDSLEDHERPLKKRGKKDIKLIAKVMKKSDLKPELIITSSAVRAKETAELLAEALGYKGKINTSDELYMGEPSDYLKILQGIKEKYNSVLFVGHNPGLEAYLQIIDGEIESLPTGGLGYLMLAVDEWDEITIETMGDLVGFWKPKDLREDK